MLHLEVDLANFLFPDLKMNLLPMEGELLEFYHATWVDVLMGCVVRWDSSGKAIKPILAASSTTMFGLFAIANQSILPSGERLHSNGKSTHFQWENPLFLWPFSIAMLVHQRVNIISFKVRWLFRQVLPIFFIFFPVKSRSILLLAI